jgi:DNA-directed RNA polymerase subunit RPC12/RpoP
MHGTTTAQFKCARCNALYHLVKVEAGPETVDRELACRVCGALLPARGGSYVLEYLLFRKPARPDSRARPGRSGRKSSSGLTDTPTTHYANLSSSDRK